jgi:hypothetical protein
MPDANWDESMVREGCLCGHGQYDHPNFGLLGRLAGQRSSCIRCSCSEFQRDRSGDPPRTSTWTDPAVAS